MTALVVEADDPLDNRIKVGKQSLGLVRILIDSESPPIYAARSFKLDRNHWPVRGMQLPVMIDPARPDDFEVAWDQVPSMEQRAAANDPALADPFAAKSKAMEALLASGVGGPDGVDARTRDTVVAAQVAAYQADGGTSIPSHFQESLDAAAAASAPAGKTRAVVLIAASEATLTATQSGEHSTRYHRDRHGKHAAVLSVHVPGREPYAVYKAKFDHKRGKGLPFGAGFPALVSDRDPTDVEIVWDEMQSAKQQQRENANEAVQTASDRMSGALQQARAEMAGWSGTAPVVPGTAAQVSPDLQAMMLQNAQTALASTKDPKMRKMLIDQYRMAGIDMDDDGTIR